MRGRERKMRVKEKNNNEKKREKGIKSERKPEENR